jgi:hypothetical protein
VFFNNTLVAAANSDVLVGLDINPTFTNGAFTGVGNVALRATGNAIISGTLSGVTQYGTIGGGHYMELISTTSTNGYVNFRRVGGANGTYAYQLNNGGAYFSNNNNTGETSVVAGSGGFFLNFYSNGTEAMRIFSSTRNVVIQNGGTFTDAGFRLDVNGTARVQDLVHLSNASGGQIRMWTSTANNSGIYGINSSSTGIYGNAHVQFDLFVRSTGSGTKKFGQSSLGNTNNICITNNNTSLEPIMITTTDSGAVGIMKSTSTIPASAVFEIESTTKGFLPPRMTTTQKNAIATPAAGLMVFDTTLVKLCVYNGTTWETITSI